MVGQKRFLKKLKVSNLFIVLGDRLTVGHLPLKESILVRIQVSQHCAEITILKTKASFDIFWYNIIMKNKIILSTIFVFILFSLYYKTQAVLGPMLAVNDSLKECQIYSPNSKEELKEGWKNYGQGGEKDCELLGYTWSDKKITKQTTESLIKYIGTLIVFVGLVFLSYLLLVRRKKKYILFILSIFAIYLLLSFITSLFQRVA